MDPITSLHARPKAWLANSVLAPHAAAFSGYLTRARYSARSRGNYVASLAHLARWMSQSCLPLCQLDEAAVELFLTRHLPRCDCPRPVMRTLSALRAACAHMLKVLRECEVIAEPAGATGPIAEELDRYDVHLREVRGLSEGTRRGGLRLVQRLLRYKFADGPVVFAQLQPEDLRQFIATQLELRGTTSNATALISALRGYLRYRTSCGDRVHALAGVIASPAHWSLAPLPRALRPFEIKRLLSSFTAELPSPRRGYAMVRCALDLGLRSSEVAQLRLTDIDWRAGTVTLRHTKSRREDVLPLLASTGRALADYLRYERPKSSNPAIFVRRLAPHDQPISAHAVRRVIRDAFARIGLTHGRSHALRHTLACRLLDRGGSIKEVADVLRHRSLNTSLIYAKLDHPRLAAVALPWPGSST
jgi:site-specific recombinase XerC